ncbi:BrnT family toxin [Patescibacteria group bacterium]|nr:BrnT family toxin [Patescibacteria group bacterium]MBU1885795.1 BrnT family toxin [Patescibacteria group bacterium]
MEHIKKHKVEIKEIEESLKDEFVVFIIGHTKRIMSLGRFGKRLITVVLQKQENSIYYVVTARDMAKKERLIYRQEKIRKEQNEK